MNLNQMTKAEILQRWNWKCKHGHNGIAHSKCYDKDHDITEKVAFFDIETSGLSPQFAVMYCWFLKEEGGTIHYDVVTPKEILSPQEDKRIVQSLCDKLHTVDRVVTQYGTYFDLTFSRTKAEMHGIKNFPAQGELYHTDVWKIAKTKLKLHSNRQNIISEALFGQSNKTRINHRYWRLAGQGNQAALSYILKHCEQDVVDLENNFQRLRKYIKLGKTSI